MTDGALSIASRVLVAAGFLTILDALPATAQVRVETRLEKTTFVAGEPVFLLADVTNLFAEPIAYDMSFGFEPSVKLEVQHRTRTAPLFDRIASCPSGNFASGGGGVDHPLQIAPGSTRTFRYLLTGYDLPPGQYRLVASGRVNLSWKYYPSRDTPLTPTPMARSLDGQPVDGGTISRTLSFTVEGASSASLRDAYEPYLARAEGADVLERVDARQVIFALAPPLLEESIIRFTLATLSQVDGLSYQGVEALGRIGTTRTRAVLRDLLSSTTDAHLQASIIRALGAAGTGDDVAFLTDVLRDRSRDERMRQYAALGLGRIGTDDAVLALAGMLATAPGSVPGSILAALGISRSRTAVRVLIEAVPRATNEQLRIGGRIQGTDISDVCGALAMLTHYRWCEGARSRDALAQRWSRFWADQGATLELFGNDACIVEELLPVIPDITRR